MSLYRKYRAKIFDEIISQGHVTNILKLSIIKQNYSHSYLFYGTRGSGKTSIARIFARALNCLDNKYVFNTGNPCNQCDSCKLSLSSSHPDIIEMDAASNRGIDEIRSIKESVTFSPTYGNKKIYIIDEVHMMTKEAFNALLKTLEEPPNHVVFILCTTDIYKVPLTIISRSQVFEFRPASIDDLVFKIKKILSNENKLIDDKGINFIAKLAKGSFRDAESILEKVLMIQKDSINYYDVLDVLGFSETQNVLLFKDYLYKRLLTKIVQFLNSDLSESNVQNFNYQLCEEVYADIVSELNRGLVDNYKILLFDFLTSLEKELKTTLNPKIVYASKILNFIQMQNDSNNINSSWKNLGQDADASDVRDHANESVKNNHLNSNSNNQIIKNEDKIETDIVYFKSNRDSKGVFDDVNYIKDKFLSFLRLKNVFLYELFTNLDFKLNDNSELEIWVNEEKDNSVFVKPLAFYLIQEFSDIEGVNIKLLFLNDLNVSKNDKNVKHVNKRKVIDLTDDELKKILS